MTHAFDDCLPADDGHESARGSTPARNLSTRPGSHPLSRARIGDVLPLVVVTDRSPGGDTPPVSTKPGSGSGRAARRRFAGLDGLRAVAVVAVVLFHLDFSLTPGGFLGVDVFFVISGFLITNLLCSEILKTGRLDLGRFYLRRARRLLPTVLALLLVVSLAACTFWRDQLATLRGGVLSSLTYVTNWWLIADHQSYFVVSGRPPMLQHLWSLAIEEQFYLVWSLAVLAIATLVFGWRRWADPVRRMRFVVVTAAGLAVVSTLAMAVVAVREDLPYGASTSRVYFGSDTHTMGLFLGSAAGAWLALARRSSDAPRRKRAAFVSLTDVVGLVAVIAVVDQFFTVTEFSPRLYRGGFLALDAVVLVAILCAVRAGSLFGRLLDIRPVRWLGQRSYSIYIWHWPVAVVTRPGLDVHGPELMLNLERLALILGLSALSYRFIEVPLRTGQWRVWRDRERAGERAGEPDGERDDARDGAREGARSLARRRWQLGSVAVTAVAVIALLVASDPVRLPVGRLAQPGLGRPVGHTGVPGPRPPGGRPAGHSHTGTAAPAPSPTLSQHGSAGPTSSPSGSTSTQHSTGATSAGVSTHPQPPPAQAGAPAISGFGDSVLLGARTTLGDQASVLQLDAVEGRQAYDVLNDISSRAEAGRLEPDVVIHVGDNGIISPDQLTSTLAQLRDRHRVVLMTVRVPRDWQDPNNDTIRNAAAQYPNVRVVDWYAMSADHPGWLYSDGIHLTPAGAVAYAGMVLRALEH